jgi:hypothetical protein
MQMAVKIPDDALAALAAKYDKMAALRRALPKQGEPATALTPAQKAELKAFAVEFPGALRELDSLSTAEIDRRRRLAIAAAAGGEREPWMGWMYGYHALMRLALQVKMRLHHLGGQNGPPALPDELATALIGQCPLPVEPAFLAQVASPPHGRLNVAVFAELERLFGVPARLIWDALFPTRSKLGRDYRT